MADDHSTAFSETHVLTPTPSDVREALLKDPGFGRVFTDHMATVRYSEGRGWYDAKVGPREAIPMDPASTVFHYAQEIFEGMKAYRTQDGHALLFRPEQNARRFQQSAVRMSMPELPESLFLEAVERLVSIDRDWIPGGEGSLYLRPFMIATQVALGVRPSSDYLFVVIASSVGAYFGGAGDAVTIWVSQDFTRAAFGGTGAAKCGGNYAASLIAQAAATRQGCDQVVFLDAVERRWVEELGGMNVFFVFADGSVQTPPLGGTILPGVTRASILTLCRDEGLEVREAPYAIDQWKADAQSGRLVEAFACGTAAVVKAIGAVKSPDGQFSIGNGGEGARTLAIRDALVGVQKGLRPDPHGWVRQVF